MATIKAPCGGIQLDGTVFKVVGDVVTSVASVASTFTTAVVCGGIKFDTAYFKNVKNVLTIKDSTETTIDDVLVGACGGIAVDGAYFTITDGVMTFDATPTLITLTITSELGTEDGDTAISVTPELTSGNTYVYKTGLTVADPTYDQDLSTWTAWDGVSDITAPIDHEIIVAEINDSSDCRGFGSTIVVSTDALETLTVVSAEGTTSGDTKITVTPELTDGRTYVYKTGVTVTLPAFGDDLSTWTAWDGIAEITATTGEEIAISEVFGDLCRATGKDTVVSLA